MSKPNNGQPTPAPTRDPNAPVYSAGWSSIEITNELIRRALTSVRYAANYEKYMKTRVCLNRINGIKARTVNDVDSYLYNVDGCELSDVTSNGRCDPYSCRLYTYEVKVSQKTVGSDAYVVQSIFKSLTQKSLAELMRMGNLDITGDSGSGESDPQSQPALFLLSEGMELPPPDVPRRIHTSASIPNLALLALVATMYPPLKTTIASLDLPV
ncbi:TPA: hypothetical protein N0F65_001033 [Lagenidium giganteum]|uniref:Uncharacterized protein n=1 Tax=Lagenidium giganteum TaxID=4803 RepID=A0AAV2YZ85_9STRA|nr:TPA: hypothetical protein N0F65_001033 [Lagenidium giganteum]